MDDLFPTNSPTSTPEYSDASFGGRHLHRMCESCISATDAFARVSARGKLESSVGNDERPEF